MELGGREDGVEVEVGREVEDDVGRDVEELLEVEDVEDEDSDVEDEDEDSEVEELSPVDVEELSEVVELEDLVEDEDVEELVDRGVLVGVDEDVVEVIGAGASDRWFFCGLYFTLPGGGSFFTGSPWSASDM